MTADDTIRVLRILEYVGPRSEIEKTLSNSIQGEIRLGRSVIRAATLGLFPEILESDSAEPPTPMKESDDAEKE